FQFCLWRLDPGQLGERVVGTFLLVVGAFLLVVGTFLLVVGAFLLVVGTFLLVLRPRASRFREREDDLPVRLVEANPQRVLALEFAAPGAEPELELLAPQPAAVIGRDREVTAAGEGEAVQTLRERVVQK